MLNNLVTTKLLYSEADVSRSLQDVLTLFSQIDYFPIKLLLQSKMPVYCTVDQNYQHF